MKQLKSVATLFEERWEHRGFEIVKKKFVKRHEQGAYQLLGKFDELEPEVILSCSSLGGCIKLLNEMTREADQ